MTFEDVTKQAIAALSWQSARIRERVADRPPEYPDPNDPLERADRLDELAMKLAAVLNSREPVELVIQAYLRATEFTRRPSPSLWED